MTSLFDKFDLHGITLSNKIVMAPMTRSRASSDNIPSPLAATYYAQRATAGLIITEATAVSKQGCGYPNIPGIWNDEQVKGWKQIANAVHEKGGKIFMQFFHTGRISHSSLIGEQPVSSSDVPASGQVLGADYHMHNYEAPRALLTDEVPMIVSQFEQAAKNAKAAGMDGIEIHAANGYLIDQFLRNGVNQRHDEFGGSIENRARLLMKILKISISVFGEHKVGVRVSPQSGFNSMSDTDPMTTFCKIASMLNDLPIAYLHIVESDAKTPNIASEIRATFKGVIIDNEGLTKASADDIVNVRHKADLVSFGTPFISNPDLVRRLQDGLPLATADTKTFYTGGEKGYIDYPNFA